ncbi:MAG TPA: RNA polymerase sigma factor [Steroidobacteraceae bacterium]|nr:RNA polymerase sigma factor [Steroidobacteraceae bacterium]
MNLSSRASESARTAEPASISDAVLVEAARRGDMRAFERLYRMHSGRVLGLCLRMTRQREIAEDCVQQTFVRAWKNLAAFEGRSAFGTWLHRIAVNEVLTNRRNRGTRSEGTSLPTQEEDEDTFENVADLSVAADSGDVMDMEKALATLPEGSRHVVVLQAVYGYSHEEVAEMLGIAVGTCKAQLHRGRRLLRERLGLQEELDS